MTLGMIALGSMGANRRNDARRDLTAEGHASGHE